MSEQDPHNNADIIFELRRQLGESGVKIYHPEKKSEPNKTNPEKPKEEEEDDESKPKYESGQAAVKDYAEFLEEDTPKYKPE